MKGRTLWGIVGVAAVIAEVVQEALMRVLHNREGGYF